MIVGKTITAQTKVATDYLSIAALKRHLHIEDSNTDHDTYLGEMLPACFDLVDAHLGYNSRKCTVEYLFNDLKISRGDYYGATLSIGNCLHIPARLISISSVKYLDGNGAEQTLQASDYQALNSFSASYGFDLEIINAPSNTYDYGWIYKVTAVEGFEVSGGSDLAKVMPADIIHAVKLIAGQYWANRMAVSFGSQAYSIPFGVESLIAKHAVKEFM